MVLWAWERPEDLRFLDPSRHAAAVLVATLRVPAAGPPRIVPRRQPLRIPQGLPWIAVTRIEVDAGAPLDDRTGLASRLAAVIAATIRAPESAPPEPAAEPATTVPAKPGREQALLPDLVAVQVDFDARRSERSFYAALLDDLRRHVGELTLSITALASWCLGDPWIEDLPIDEAVPMLFRLGVDERTVRGHLAAGGDFSRPVCRQSLGLSTDEPWSRLPPSATGAGAPPPRRLYLFHPRPWTPEALAAALRQATGGSEPPVR